MASDYEEIAQNIVNESGYPVLDLLLPEVDFSIPVPTQQQDTAAVGAKSVAKLYYCAFFYVWLISRGAYNP